MARPSTQPKLRLMQKFRYVAKNFPQLAEEFANSWNLVKILIALEALICYLVIEHVKYTEIDWSTYMAQVEQIFNFSRPQFDYAQVAGPTGPLVYPAGHTYVFYLLGALTEGGGNIRSAQYIFLIIYIGQLYYTYKIYSHKKTFRVPPYVFLVMCLTSYRIHSIYILRLFNDCIAVLVAYASFYYLLRKRYALSAFVFSLAISIKMNILLYAPAYALIFYEDLGFMKSFKYATIAIGTQVLLAAPYLCSNPINYITRSFDFGRVFLHEWTVNWRFLSQDTFTSPQFFKLLLIIHLALLFILFWSRWLNVLTLNKLILNGNRRDDHIMTLFIANFIGVVCSRSLHYQFYVWYYHSLPMIVWSTRYSIPFKMLILGCIEYAWNEFPSTNFSSLLLHTSHLIIVIGLVLRQFKTTSIVSVKNKAHANTKSFSKRRR